MRLREVAVYLIQDIKSLFFILALILYGVFSSPTPDTPDLIEVLIFGFLAFALFGSVSFLLKPQKEKWHWACFALLIYGFSVSFAMGVAYNQDISIIIRDLIGFVFLLLPALIVPYILQKVERERLFLYGVLFIGVAFSLRVLFVDFDFYTPKDQLLYLANSPLVLFLALFSLLKSYDIILSKVTLNNLVKAGAFGLVGLIALFAMFIDFQRASFVAVGFSFLAITLLNLYQRPLKLILPTLIGLVFIVIFYDYGAAVLERLITKTSQVGLNMREQEFVAVWYHVKSEPFTLLFGFGWGARFESPAVGYLPVAYTHSLISYMLLKTGLVGLGLTLIYLGFIFEKLCRLVFIRPIELNALFWPFIIPILFYASYKSFDFGLLLALILVMASRKGVSKIK